MKLTFMPLVMIMLLTPGVTQALLKCPAPGPAYQEIINRLETFSQEMVIDETCKTLKRDAEAMQNSMMSMGGFFGIGGGGSSQELSIIELSFLMRASNAVISSAKNIVDQLLSQPQCMQENGVSVLQLLSTATQQITGLGAAFSGPYGIPVSFGGAAVAGILQGIDVLIQRHNYGYKFKESEHRNLFVANLCTYHDIRQEVVDMLYPQNRMLAYQTLISELENRQNQLVANYPVCSRYQTIYNLQHEAMPQIQSIRSSFDKVSLDGKSPSQWSLCLRLAELVHPDHSTLQNIVDQLPDTGFSDFQKIVDLFGFARSETGILTPGACWAASSTSLLDANLRSKSIISEIIRGTESSYQEELRSIYREARDADPERNFVELLDKTLAKISWASGELSKLETVAGDHTYQGRKELNSYKKNLDNRLFSVLAPKFMNWYHKEGKKSIERYKRHKKKNTRKIAEKFFGLGFFDKTPETKHLIKRSMKEQAGNRDLHVRLYAMTERLLTSLSNAHLAIGTIEDFTEYFSKSGTLSKDMIKLREGSRSQKMSVFMHSQAPVIDTMIHYLDWCHEKGFIEADGIKTLIEKIRNCRLSRILEDGTFQGSDLPDKTLISPWEPFQDLDQK